MRGDSIRDLYAKTLALLGLGVLAGTGALVDYWPSSPSLLPLAGPALVSPQLAMALPVPALQLPPLPEPSRSAVAVEHRVPVTLRSLPVNDAADFLVGRPVELTGPPPVSFASMPVQAYAPAGEELSFYEPLDAAPVSTIALATPSLSPAVDDDRDSFITGASKRIGASIVRGGVKTGAFIADVVRVSNRAVRRVLPD